LVKNGNGVEKLKITGDPLIRDAGEVSVRRTISIYLDRTSCELFMPPLWFCSPLQVIRHPILNVAPNIRFATVMALRAIVSGIAHALIETASPQNARTAQHG
jgi:hypothetical protein